MMIFKCGVLIYQFGSFIGAAYYVNLLKFTRHVILYYSFQSETFSEVNLSFY